jgi:DNA adenine methylase
MKPCLKWVGGKRQLLGELHKYIPQEYSTYVEPFFGGGALFFDEAPQHAIINDYNSSLMNVYNQIKNNVDEFLLWMNELDKVYVDVTYYMHNRQEFNDQKIRGELSPKHAAFFVWLNKHSFNGVYRENSKGLYNVPFNKREGMVPSINTENIQEIHTFLAENDVTITSGDYKDVCTGLPENSVVYLDPPYVPESITANFTSYTKKGFTYQDHLDVHDVFEQLVHEGHTVIMSNSNTELVHELYAEHTIDVVGAMRSINRDGTGRKGKEVIIRS